jgi:hypothetical protein
VYLKSGSGWFAEEGSVEWVAVGVGDETLELEGESSGVGVFSIIDGKVFDSPDFFANVMDLVDGVDAAVAGGGDEISHDCILEVTFSGGSAPFRPRAELRAADMLALHLRLQWSKIKFQFRGMWVVYSVNFDGCQSICRGAFEQKLWSQNACISVR